MFRRALSLVVLGALIAGACTSAPVPTGGSPGLSPGASPVGATGVRLATVKSRGQLICGVNGGLAGFSFLDTATNTWSGFDADFCRALAAAVLGDPTKVDFRALDATARGPALQTGEVDVLIRNTTWTVSRDTSWGLFAPTTFYDGQGMMVHSSTGATTLEDLAGATICVQSGTTTELNLSDQMRARNIEFTPDVVLEIDPTYERYESGLCDAVTSDRSQLISRRTSMANLDEHVILDVVMSKEPLGPVAPLNDDQWFNVVKWTVFAIIQAEESGLTQANVAEMASTSTDPVIKRLLGVQPDAGTLASGLGLADDWVVDVITAVGNYGEIYDRNLGPNTDFNLDRGPNTLWTEGGLLYAAPYR